MTRLAPLVALLLAGCAPVAFDAAPWDAPPAPRMEGALAPNHALELATFIAPGRLDGPEDVAVDPGDPEHPLYTGLVDGRIVRIDLEPGHPARVTTIAQPEGGIPLGLKCTVAGHLLVCDAGIGLLDIDLRDPAYPVRLLTNACNGKPLHFVNDLDVARDGTIYFSESSDRRYLPRGYDALYANLEARPEGSLYAYDPRTRTTRKLLDGLYFANGVAVTDDQQAVLVVETAHNRALRLGIAGPRTGHSEVFNDNLPGLADGIMGDGHGRYWVAMNAHRSPLADFTAPYAWMRGTFALLPGFLLYQIGIAENYGLVVAYNDAGRPVMSLHDGTGRFEGGLANAEPYGGKLYLGTKWGHQLAVVDLPP